ncbi:pilus assembly protein [Ramlibacter henchirensis]|uniref:Type II secretion system protein H n=2 Tax=Ramlibacter henchirensis TaxID=204072 RepID=A0A4Z0C341_9BURK|nr:pilus assembly protein [Ramlibacter henchirensis]
MVELLVVLVLLAIIISLAAPSFARLSSAAAISSGVNQFMADMRFARSEGIRRGGGVVLCRSDDPESPATACAGGAPADWVTGWIVFHDLDGDGARDADEQVLRVQARPAGIDSIAADGTPTVFRFAATGRLLVPGSFSSLRFGSANLPADIRRIVCVAPGGRARIAGDGGASCGPGD